MKLYHFLGIPGKLSAEINNRAARRVAGAVKRKSCRPQHARSASSGRVHEMLTASAPWSVHYHRGRISIPGGAKPRSVLKRRDRGWWSAARPAQFAELDAHNHWLRLRSADRPWVWHLRLEIAEDGFDLEILQNALETVLASVSGLLEASERRVGIPGRVVKMHLTGADA